MALPPLNFQNLDMPEQLKEWLRQVRNTLTTGSGLVAWTSVDKSGANITDIPTRNHNDLLNEQGGSATELYHLTAAQHTDLTDAGDSALHFHSTDRARANHTGTQTLATISDAGTIASQDANNVSITGGTVAPTVLQAPTYTVATVPSAATAARIIYVSDEVGGAVLAFSDGTNWRRVTDRAIVS